MITNFGLLDFGTPELILILVIILLLFGAKKLPALTRSVGESMSELRKGMNGDDKETKKSETVSKDSDRRV